MDWKRIEGSWKQAQDKLQKKWSQLTDDDLNEIKRKREQLEGTIQQRYGTARP